MTFPESQSQQVVESGFGTVSAAEPVPGARPAACLVLPRAVEAASLRWLKMTSAVLFCVASVLQTDHTGPN